MSPHRAVRVVYVAAWGEFGRVQGPNLGVASLLSANDWWRLAVEYDSGTDPLRYINLVVYLQRHGAS